MFESLRNEDTNRASNSLATDWAVPESRCAVAAANKMAALEEDDIHLAIHAHLAGAFVFHLLHFLLKRRVCAEQNKKHKQKLNQSRAKSDSVMTSRHAPVFVESMMSSSSSFGSLLLFFFRLRRFLFFFLDEAFPLFSASVCFCSAPLSVTTSVSLVVSNKNINITKIKH